MKQGKIFLKTLANKIAASKECKEPFKSDAIEAIEEMEKLLPHESGIDGNINFDIDKSNKNKIVVFFVYHHTNEKGYYNGWTSHELIITPSFTLGFDMRITGTNKNKCKDYFYDLFSEVFTSEEPNTQVN